MVAERSDLVSVVIPAYKAGRFIARTIQSALGQTYHNLEVIVVDDGSTDDTRAIVEAIMAEDPRVRLLRQANAGVAAARNHGTREARGTLIALLDADDLWHPEKIAKQVAAMQRGGPEVGVVYTWHREIDEADRVLSSPEHQPYEGDVYAALVLFNFVGGGSGALIRRTCLIEAGGFDSGLRAQRAQGSEDTKLFLAIAERHDFAVVPEFLMGYRRTGGSMSHDVRQMVRSRDLVLAEVQRCHPELPGALFRWARGECSSWLAIECLCGGRFGLGAFLLFRTLLYDPAAVFRPRTFRAIMRGLLKPLGLSPVHSGEYQKLRRLRFRWKRDIPAGRPCFGQQFLTVDPEPEISVVVNGLRPKKPRFEERRQAIVATWRIRRRSSGAENTYVPDLERSATP